MYINKQLINNKSWADNKPRSWPQPFRYSCRWNVTCPALQQGNRSASPTSPFYHFLTENVCQFKKANQARFNLDNVLFELLIRFIAKSSSSYLQNITRRNRFRWNTSTSGRLWNFIIFSPPFFPHFVQFHSKCSGLVYSWKKAFIIKENCSV